MATKVILKKSAVAAKVPLSTDLDYGELALNYADGKLYYKNSVNTVGVLNTGTGTVTSVSGTGTVSGLSLSGTVTESGSLSLGGTLDVSPSNFSSQTAKTFLAAPNAAAGTPTFRTILASDIPTLNQSTTGSAASLTTARTISLTGDVTGSVSFNGTADASITATVADGSHNHVISNVGGLQTALDSKTGATEYLGVGSVALLLSVDTTTVAFGGSVAGTSLRYDYVANANAMDGSGIVPFAAAVTDATSTYSGGGTAVAGTWRKISSGSTYFTTTTDSVVSYWWVPALFMRTA